MARELLDLYWNKKGCAIAECECTIYDLSGIDAKGLNLKKSKLEPKTK